jgi:hypothetical protein
MATTPLYNQITAIVAWEDARGRLTIRGTRTMRPGSLGVRMPRVVGSIEISEFTSGSHQIGAASGAHRRSAKNADAPMNQSREAHHPARPAPLPEGDQSGGVPSSVQGVRLPPPDSVDFARLA